MRTKHYTLIYEENTELVTAINAFANRLEKMNENDLLDFLPIAFFKIFVKFQTLVATLFTSYCLGEASSVGYLPERRHIFSGNTELRAFLKAQKSDYVDYDKRIDELSRYIFADDPFSKLNQIAPLNYANMKHIRNHIAHENQETEAKLQQMQILKSGESLGQYFLTKSRHTSKINYNSVIESIYNMSIYLIEGERS